ncbi:hypothetical protein CEXT_7291 [Caerostris extrusa]|uniref:Uncharacterized protein n=1 Tax=Caerostris extrusa TaxID=172846 RepID=A0AAV4P9L5_CAEEX|nr:hypothetical protein CEXT_7291 [Caerostris extrusa]
MSEPCLCAYAEMDEKDLEVVFAPRYLAGDILGKEAWNGRSSTCFYPWRTDCGDLCRNRNWSAYLGHWPVVERSLDVRVLFIRNSLLKFEIKVRQ